MIQKALLFIPDISGFTEFVHFTDLSHSKHIISELLEVLLDANSTNLELAEIEGDAVFFYKLSDVVDIDEVNAQIRKMYIAFHTHLKRYEYERICHCGACSSAYNLSLKFVTHFGDIDFITVRDISKPYGSNVIQAHRLLKNEIPESEYALFTNTVVSQEGINEENVIIGEYDFGTIPYTYNILSDLKKELPYVTPIPNDVPRHALFHIEETIRIPALDLYEIISNFDYRLLWIKGIDILEYEKNRINRSGTKHQCLFDENKGIHQTTVKKEVGPNQLVYGESAKEVPFTKKVNLYYVLEEIDEGVTKMDIQAYADFKPFGILMKPLLAKKFKNNIVENIKELILLINSGFTIENQRINNEDDRRP